MDEHINLSGINGIRANVSIGFRKVVEDVIERVVASPELADVDSATIAELVSYAVKDFDIEYLQIRKYIDACRETANKSTSD